MADISKSKPHSYDIDTIKERVEKFAGDIAKKMGIKYVWDGYICSLSGSAIKNGKITVTEGDVSIEVNLGMMAKMMKPMIEKEIDAKISEIVS